MILKKNSYHKLNGKTLKHVFFQRHGFGKNIEGETGTSGKEHPSSRLKDARCCHQLVTKALFSVVLRLEVKIKGFRNLEERILIEKLKLFYDKIEFRQIFFDQH